MKTVKSKYKIWGGLPLLAILNAVFLPFSWLSIISTYKNLLTPCYEWKGVDFGIPIFIIFMQLFLLFILMKDCRYIKIYADKITFVNPIFPFLKKTNYWNDYDYMQTIEVLAGFEFHEEFWLIKNRKLKVRISSFYYSNYDELKNSVNIENRGELFINPIKQIYCLLGMKI